MRCAKVGQGRGVTYREALDEALCFGWIDGVRHAIDAKSFAVRFTPRKPKSAWSRVNADRFAALRAEGRVEAPGRAAYEQGTTPDYSYESRPQALDPALEKRLRARRGAWSYFQSQAPWYRRTSAFWVMSARRAETRERRFETLLRCSEEGCPIPLLRRAPSPGAKTGASVKRR